MNTALLSKLRQLTNQLFAYLYSVVFVLVGSRVVIFVQQSLGFLWPCDYVEAWWETQGSTATVMACSQSGHDLTIVIGTATAFGIVLVLVRNLKWRLRLVACVAALYFLLRLGYIINAIGREQAMSLLGNALFVTRLEFAGLALFALTILVFQYARKWRLYVVIAVALLLVIAFIHELMHPGGANPLSLWKAVGLTVLASLVCALLGHLPARTSRWLGVGGTEPVPPSPE